MHYRVRLLKFWFSRTSLVTASGCRYIIERDSCSYLALYDFTTTPGYNILPYPAPLAYNVPVTHFLNFPYTHLPCLKLFLGSWIVDYNFKRTENDFSSLCH